MNWAKPSSRRLGRSVAALLTLSFFAVQAPATLVQAQSEDCESLRQQLATASDPSRGSEYVRALQRQRAELARTRAYADQIGCGGFSFFSDGPPQCDGLESQIQRMENNLGLLQSQAEQSRGLDAGQRTDLQNRYATYCNANSGADSSGLNDDPLRQGWDDLDSNAPDRDSAPRGRGGKAICVRTCDGGFFPLGDAGSDEGLTGLQSLCSALCPNTEAKLYTTPDTDNLESAISVDGTAYSALPAAFKFQKTFDATCTCKPPGKSWVEALAQAETLLEKGDKDVTVTSSMSDAMARPGQATPVPRRRKNDRKSKVDLQAAESAVGASAPTASSDSAGISKSDSGPERLVKTGEGSVKELAGPDGAKRRVRIIGPLL